MKNLDISLVLNRSFANATKKLCLAIFALSILSLGVFGAPILASKQQIGMYKNSKTCVVLENGISSYNHYIKAAVEKYWNTTSFEFIDQVQFESRRHDSQYSFLVLMKGVWDKDPGGVSYNYLTLVLGDPAYDMAEMPEICSIPLSYTDGDEAGFQYAFPSIVKFMQKHAENLEKNRFLISLSGLKYYNGSKGFKDKVLLINKDMVASDADSPEKINTIYPYYIKLLTAAEIQEELSANPSNALFHYHVGPPEDEGAGKCFEMIFDIEGNLYYYNYRMITNDNEDGFNLNDFRHVKQ